MQAVPCSAEKKKKKNERYEVISCWGASGHLCMHVKRHSFLSFFKQPAKVLNPESNESTVYTNMSVLQQMENFLRLKGLCPGRRDFCTVNSVQLKNPPGACPDSSYQDFRQCPSIIPRAEEQRGRRFTGRVVAQAKQRTVLFDVLPKVCSRKNKLWPVRNLGCGGKCFLGWGKQASCLHIGCQLPWAWLNKYVGSGWRVIMIVNILDGLTFNDFQNYPGVFFKASEKLLLMNMGIILCNKCWWCFGTSKTVHGRLKFLIYNISTILW